MIRLATIAVAAFVITVTLTAGAGLLASSAMHALLAHHEQRWWPLLMNGFASIGWMTPVLSVGIAVRVALQKQRVRGRSPHRTQKLPVLGL